MKCTSGLELRLLRESPVPSTSVLATNLSGWISISAFAEASFLRANPGRRVAGTQHPEYPHMLRYRLFRSRASCDGVRPPQRKRPLRESRCPCLPGRSRRTRLGCPRTSPVLSGRSIGSGDTPGRERPAEQGKQHPQTRVYYLGVGHGCDPSVTRWILTPRVAVAGAAPPGSGPEFEVFVPQNPVGGHIAFVLSQQPRHHAVGHHPCWLPSPALERRIKMSVFSL